MRNLHLIRNLVTLCLITLSACQAQEADRGFLYGTPCAAPCWYGIVPGTTTRETALKSIQNLEIIQEGTVREVQSDVVFSRVDGVGGSLRFKDGIVIRVAVGTDNELSLGDVVAAYGAPSLAVAFGFSGEKDCYKVELFYPLRGIQVDSFACQDSDVHYQLTEFGARVRPEMPATLVTFWQPADTLEKMLLNSGLAAERARAKANDAVQWTGFGYYPLVSGYW